MSQCRADNRKGVLVILAIVMLSLVMTAVSPLLSEQSDATSIATCEGLTVSTYDDSLEMSAGHSVSIIMTLANDDTKNISVKVSCNNGTGPLKLTVDSSDFTIKAGEYKQLTVNVRSDRYADHGDYTASVDLKVYNHRTDVSGTTSVPLSVTVKPTYASEGSFNKIMCVFDNNLPYPFNTPTSSAIITFLIWAVIAVAAYLVVHILIGRYFADDESSEKRELRIHVGGLIILVILSYGLQQSALVYGANEFVMKTINDVYMFVYTIIGAYIVWEIYKNVIKHIFRKTEKGGMKGVDTSLVPLFSMVGKIAIGTVSAAILLSLLGVNLVGILAGAGIMGIALSLGAQNTLSEMFGGLTLLTTRPFREKDLVRIGSDETVYEVIKVRLMNTEFKNWASNEHLIMPNSSVAGAKISNMTKGNPAYRLFLYYDVGYDSDLDDVKKILLDTAYNHPQVIKDGSFDKPGTRITSFDNTTIQVRLAVYIFDFRDNITVTDELIELGYKNLEEAGIDIPYERMDIHLRLANEDD